MLDVWGCVNFLEPFLKAMHRVSPFGHTQGFRTGEKVVFILLNVMATGAFLMFPEVPMFHHLANAKETTDMFGHPKAVERGK